MLILFAFVYYAFQTRNAGQIFAESTRSYVSAAFSLFIFGVTLLFRIATNDLSMILGVEAGMLLCFMFYCFYCIFFLELEITTNIKKKHKKRWSYIGCSSIDIFILWFANL